MAGLVPAIHVFVRGLAVKTWIPRWRRRGSTLRGHDAAVAETPCLLTPSRACARRIAGAMSFMNSCRPRWAKSAGIGPVRKRTMQPPMPVFFSSVNSSIMRVRRAAQDLRRHVGVGLRHLGIELLALRGAIRLHRLEVRQADFVRFLVVGARITVRATQHWEMARSIASVLRPASFARRRGRGRRSFARPSRSPPP